MGKTEIAAPPGSTQVTITREFDAPPDLVFRAHIEPDLVVQWWEPNEVAVTIEHLEARNGGRWRFVQRDADGVPGHVKLDSITFEAQGRKTLLCAVSSFQSVEDRDGMIASGLERGLTESGERLEVLLTTVRSS
jgi:hypothetical protein